MRPGIAARAALAASGSVEREPSCSLRIGCRGEAEIEQEVVRNNNAAARIDALSAMQLTLVAAVEVLDNQPVDPSRGAARQVMTGPMANLDGGVQGPPSLRIASQSCATPSRQLGMVGPGKRWLIPKVSDKDAFHRHDFARQLGARGAVMPAAQAAVGRGWRAKAPGLSVWRIGASRALRRLPDALHLAAHRAYTSGPIRSHESGPYQ